MKARDQKLKSNEESFKYKIKHLEAAERELQSESKSWKDLPSRKELERLSNEIRQLKGLPPLPAEKVEDDDTKVETKSYEPAPTSAPKQTAPAAAPAAASASEAAPAAAPAEPTPAPAAAAPAEAAPAAEEADF